MKTFYLVLLGLLLAICGCRSARPRLNAKVPEGYYLVVGRVNKPGLIKCDGSEKSLKMLIDEAGGPTREAHLASILVVYEGRTNFFDINRKAPLPCGARVKVSAVFF